MTKRALITGITGQDGAYLAKLLLEKGYSVFGFVSRRVNQNFSNLDYLGITNRIEYVFGDMTDLASINHAVRVSRPSEIYNLAAMSFVGLSWQEPIYTSQVNSLGVLNFLESMKDLTPTSKFYQASTSEMFGNSAEKNGTQNENTKMIPRSPYGFSKLFAHNAVRNYRESFGIFACSGVLFNHESPIRGLEFVTRKITDGVAQIVSGKKKFIELGNLEARRDWGFAGDYVEAMWLMLQEKTPDDYVVATGKNWSIKELLSVAFEYADIKNWEKYVKVNPLFLRPAELVSLKGDSSKAKEVLGWSPRTSFNDLIKLMVNEDIKRHSIE